jgi:hypothetical protein
MANHNQLSKLIGEILLNKNQKQWNICLGKIKIKLWVFNGSRQLLHHMFHSRDNMNNKNFYISSSPSSSLCSTFGSLVPCVVGCVKSRLDATWAALLRLRSYYLTHSWGLDWWVPGCVQTPVGHDHCTSGAPTCSEIPNRFCLEPQGIQFLWATT